VEDFGLKSVFNPPVSRVMPGADMASDAKQSKNPAAVALGRMDRNFIERQ
jgi:hypothetical protein